MSEQAQEAQQQEIPFEATPHVWLHHGTLTDTLEQGKHWVQVLSMESDGLWVRILDDGMYEGWKIYVPMKQVWSLVMEDDAWPKNAS